MKMFNFRGNIGQKCVIKKTEQALFHSKGG